MEFAKPPYRFNLAEYVLAKVAQYPDKPALEVIRGVKINYRELERSVLGMAGGIKQIGLKRGQHVLLRLGNTPLFPIAYLGAIAAGMVPVVTSSKLSQREVDDIARETKPALVLNDGGLSIPSEIKAISENELQEFQRGPIARYDRGDPDRPAYIIYTSGTSGQPRAVVHAHRAVWARQSMFDGWYGSTADDRVMHAGAFNWTYTLGTGLIDPWTIGATAVIPSEHTDPSELPNLIAEHEVSIFAAAPGIYRRMNRAEFPTLPCLRHGLSAGEKLPKSTREYWEKQTGRPILEAYGMSECSTFISQSPRQPNNDDTLGRPQPGRRIALISDGVEADHGVIAIHKSDLGLMRGYLNQTAETQAKYSGDWFLTGDIGSKTAAGTIRYEGRADDMMNAGGTRVSPIEVETVLNSFDKIDEAACAEVQLNQEISLIAAFYTASEMIDEDELKSALAAVLADYKVPRIFVRVASLPRGKNNKLLRQKLRQDWETAHGQA